MGGIHGELLSKRKKCLGVGRDLVYGASNNATSEEPVFCLFRLCRTIANPRVIAPRVLGSVHNMSPEGFVLFFCFN